MGHVPLCSPAAHRSCSSRRGAGSDRRDQPCLTSWDAVEAALRQGGPDWRAEELAQLLARHFGPPGRCAAAAVPPAGVATPVAPPPRPSTEAPALPRSDLEPCVLQPCPLQRADLGWVQELAEPLRGWAGELVRLWSILYRRVRLSTPRGSRLPAGPTARVSPAPRPSPLQVSPSLSAAPANHTLLPLPHPFIVPGE
jgi:hypothetical protein